MLGRQVNSRVIRTSINTVITRKTHVIDTYIHSPWTSAELDFIKEGERVRHSLSQFGTMEDIKKRMLEVTNMARKESAKSIKAATTNTNTTNTNTNSTPDVTLPVMTISDIPTQKLYNKKVFVRVDFNVKYQKSTTTNQLEVNPSSLKRIIESLPTITHLINAGAKVILCSHLGDPTPEQFNDPKFSLAPVAKCLENLLSQQPTLTTTTTTPTTVSFVSSTIGKEVTDAVSTLQPGQVLLLENTRLAPNKDEKKNILEYAKSMYSAIQPDIYVNDAFGTAHRAHVSVVGLPSICPPSVPKVAGFLLSKEIQYLQSILPIKNKDKHSSNSSNKSNNTIVIFGGAKVSSKVPVLANLLPRANTYIIGGAMALTFLRAQGHIVGITPDSIDSVELAQKITTDAIQNQVDIILPIDFVTSKSFDKDAKTIVKDFDQLEEDDYATDIGPKSNILFTNTILDKSTKIVVWNGPMGVFEWKSACNGTFNLVQTLSTATSNGIITVVGGGETAQSVVDGEKALGIKASITHISTGGGASLELLEGKILPALTVLDRRVM